jgi:hypothetical protein
VEINVTSASDGDYFSVRITGTRGDSGWEQTKMAEKVALDVRDSTLQFLATRMDPARPEFDKTRWIDTAAHVRNEFMKGAHLE